MIQHTVKFDQPLMNAFIDESACAEGVSNEVSNEVSSDALESAEAETAVAAGDETEPVATEVSIKESNERRDELLEGIARAVGDLREQGDETVNQWQALAIRFAGIMVKQLAGSSDAIQADRLTQLVGDLVNRPELPLKIAAHPDDFPLIESCLESHGELAEKIELLPEPTVTKGECRAIYEAHDLISKLEEQLPDIEYRLMEVLQDD